MRSGVYVTVERSFVCPSVCPVDQQQQRQPVGLQLSALWAGDVDRQLRAPRTSWRRAEQHVTFFAC